jgi:hypothetical protein
MGWAQKLRLGEKEARELARAAELAESAFCTDTV